ncbi:hypothetical protein RB597_008523 [Gaeumannomyces tritici]
MGEPGLILEIQDALVRGAHGMFLWVALQIESLCSAKTDEAIRQALADLPKDLPSTFSRILQKWEPFGKDYQQKTLKLVIAARHPLTTDELREALSVNPGNTDWNPAQLLNDVYSALAYCGSLVTVDEEDFTVRLVHHSVKQFLLGGLGSSSANIAESSHNQPVHSEAASTTIASESIFDATTQELSHTTAPTSLSDQPVDSCTNTTSSVDSASIYTMQEVPGAKNYIESLTNVLFNQSVDIFPDDKTMDMLCESLPETLRAFAFSLGAEEESAAHRQAMAFVSQKRIDITAYFRSRYEEERDNRAEQQRKAQDKLPLREKFEILGVYSDLRVSADKDSFQIPSPDISEKVSEAEVSEASAEQSSQGSSYNGEGNAGEAASPEPQDLARYELLITKSKSYQWLLERVKRDLSHTQPTHKISSSIRKALNYSTGSHHISRRRGPTVSTIVFRANWDPLTIITEQEYGVAAEEAIDRALVINSGPGGLGESEALMCGEYMRRTWPLSGAIFMELMQHLVRVEPGIKCLATLHDKTGLTAMLHSLAFLLEAVGTSGSLVEVGEMFAWITTAFRAGMGKEVVQLMPIVEEITDHPITFTISIQPHETASEPQKPQGQCWRDLFRNPVVAHGFPVKRRPDRKKLLGLEVTLDMAGTEEEALVAWHVFFNGDGDRISFADPRIREAYSQAGAHAGIAQVENARHVIGWCENVKNYAGAHDAAYDIRSTSLDPPGTGFVFDRVTLTAGKYITLGVSGLIGKSHKSARITEETDYWKQLEWAEQRFVVFFDVDDRRAWLIDGLSALLHLVRASIERNRSRNVPILIGGDNSKYQLEEAPVTHTGRAAARKLLFNQKNANTPLYFRPVKRVVKKTTTREGNAEPVVKEVIEEEQEMVGFAERVDDMYNALSQIFDHQWGDTKDGVGGKVRLSPRRRVEGFDFMDLAAFGGQAFPKMMQLKATGSGWIDFVRAPAVRAVTLFGSGFGDLLVPASPCADLTAALDVGEGSASNRTPLACTRHWHSLPKGKDLLAVSTSDMRLIANGRDMAGKKLWEAVSNLYWLDPGGATFDRSDCGTAVPARDHTQVFLPTRQKLMAGRFLSPTRVPDAGAAIFGHSTLWGRLHWPDDPKLGPQDCVMTPDGSAAESEDNSGLTGASQLLSAPDLDGPTAGLGDSSGSVTSSRLSSFRSIFRSIIRVPSVPSLLSGGESGDGSSSSLRREHLMRPRRKGKHVERPEGSDA